MTKAASFFFCLCSLDPRSLFDKLYNKLTYHRSKAAGLLSDTWGSPELLAETNLFSASYLKFCWNGSKLANYYCVLNNVYCMMPLNPHSTVMKTNTRKLYYSKADYRSLTKTALMQPTWALDKLLKFCRYTVKFVCVWAHVYVCVPVCVMHICVHMDVLLVTKPSQYLIHLDLCVRAAGD